MKNKKLLTGIISVMTCIMVLFACSPESYNIPEGDIIFELYDGESEVIGSQSIFFGTSKEYIFKNSYITSMQISTPEGWKAKFYAGEDKAIITAPDITDAEADLSGTITVEYAGLSGQSGKYTMNVAVIEDDITFNLLEEVGEGIEFIKSEAKEIKGIASNASVLEIITPNGWSSSYDLSATSATIIITAPSNVEGEVEAEGIVRILPMSVKGTAGTAVEIPVKMILTHPTINFDLEKVIINGFNTHSDVTFTSENVKTLSVLNAPDGWNATFDMENKKVTIKSPPASNLVYGNGSMTFKAESVSGYTSEATIYVTVQSQSGGISSADDFIKFGEAVTAGTDYSKYMAGGEVVLLANIDLTESTHNTIVGNGVNPLNTIFNGNGCTIKIENKDINVMEWGPFHTLGTNGVIKNLNIKGELVSVYAPSSKSAHLVSAVLLYNNGGKLENVVTDVSFTYDPESYFNFQKQTNSVYDYDNCGHYGSITARVINGLARYSKCESKGLIHMKNGSMTHVGGIIGRIADDNAEINECVNRGEIRLNIGNNSGDGCKYGGIIGDSDIYIVNVSKCDNYGDINAHFVAGNMIFSAGGIAGSMYGEISECNNHGNITSQNGSPATRRFGGIVGVCGMRTGDRADHKFDFKMYKCINYGNISTTSMRSGGLLGNIERTKYSSIIDCINEGTIETVVQTGGSGNSSQSPVLGGLVGECRINLMENCENRGKITGYNRLYVGGLIALAQNNSNKTGLIKNCRNKGNIDVINKWATTVAANQLRVSGIVSVGDDGAWEIENCSNTGKLSPTLEDISMCKNIYYSRGGTVTIKDAATQAEQDSNNNLYPIQAQ